LAQIPTVQHLCVVDIPKKSEKSLKSPKLKSPKKSEYFFQKFKKYF
jgi:hypothetical protein